MTPRRSDALDPSRGILLGLVISAVLWIVVGYFAAKLHGSSGFEFTARLTATDQEADEGYFALDHQQMLVAKPGSELHAYLRGQAGKRVHITVEPATEDR